MKESIQRNPFTEGPNEGTLAATQVFEFLYESSGFNPSLRTAPVVTRYWGLQRRGDRKRR